MPASAGCGRFSLFGRLRQKTNLDGVKEDGVSTVLTGDSDHRVTFTVVDLPIFRVYEQGKGKFALYCPFSATTTGTVQNWAV